MMGFEVDSEKFKNDKITIIKRITPDSAAELSGLKSGDEIKSVAGYDYLDFISSPQRVSNIYQRGNVQVIINRKNSEKEFKVHPTEICLD